MYDMYRVLSFEGNWGRMKNMPKIKTPEKKLFVDYKRNSSSMFGAAGIPYRGRLPSRVPVVANDCGYITD